MIVLPSFPNSRQAIDDADVAFAAAFIDQSGIVGKIDARHEASKKAPGGRPALVSTRAVFIGLFLSVTNGNGCVLKEVYRVLFERVSDEARTALGLPEGLDWEDLTENGKRRRDTLYKAVRMAFARAAQHCEPVRYPKRSRVSKELALAYREAVDPSDIASIEGFLHEVMNDLLEASMRFLRPTWDTWRGNTVHDGTKVPAFARQPARTSERASSDPSASLWARVGNHNGDDVLNKRRTNTKTRRGKSGKQEHAKRRFERTRDEFVWGFEAHATVMAPNDARNPRTFPTLVVAVAIDRPGFDPGPNALRNLTSLTERGYPAGLTTGDDLIIPGSDAEKFQTPARRLGHRLVMSYQRDSMVGIQGSHPSGIIVADGVPCCPGTPEYLLDISVRHRDPKDDFDDVQFQNAAVERSHFATQIVNTRPNGTETHGCPASGPSPTARCPLRGNVRDPALTHLPLVENPPAHPPEICTLRRGKAIKADEAAPKYRQNLHYGTPEHEQVYGLFRSLIEGKFGETTDPIYENIQESRLRRVHGIGANGIMVALLLAVSNFRRARAFLTEAKAGPGGVLQIPLKDSKRTYLQEGTSPENLLAVNVEIIRKNARERREAREVKERERLEEALANAPPREPVPV